MAELSARLREVVDALPMKPGMRVLEIGCGPGAMAREMAERVGPKGAVMGVDRSAKAIEQAIAAGGPAHLSFRISKAEDFALAKSEKPYDIAVAIRVGALDGRHAEIEAAALAAIAAALKPDGKLYIDGGAPLLEVALPAYA
jgi:cyclopropane fatty-acyl-phospholipid synthase-like methyltransferase